MAELKLDIQPPTPRMIDYMLILFNDCGFTDNSRNAWLTNRYHRLIKHLDELSCKEGHEVIETLKGIREARKW